MTDLNSSLTDFDKSLISETPKPPELKPFSVWSEENKLAESDPKSYVQYSDYMREDYLNQGAYTPNVEEEISSALNSKLADFDIVDEEDIEALTATKELSFEEKLEYVYSSINGDDKDFGTLSEYKAGASAAADGGATEEYQEKVAGLREQSEEVVSRRYDGVKRSLVESNQLPMAYVINEEGQRELMVGDGAENMTVSEAIKSSKMGGVSFKDAAAVQRLLTPLDGLDINLAKFKRIASVADSIAELEKNDASVAEHVTGHIRQIARKDKTTFDNVSATVSSMLSGALTFIGVESEENNDKKKRIERASRDSFDQTIEYITEKLNDSGANYRFEDVRSAYESHVFTQGANRGLFKLHQDPKDAGKNVYKTALGPVLNPAVFARAEDMANTLAASPDLTDRQKELFTSNRAAVVKQNFSSYSKLLSESAVGDEWAAELIAGRHAGREDIDIFDAFIAKDENFNEYADSAKGIAYSVWDSVASLLYIAPAVMGADWAKEGLADASQRQSDRREVAQIFGEQYGLFQDLTESVAPLIVDITATALLSTFTAGAGGAAYLTARGGAQLTAKGLAKSLTSNILRASSKEGLESVAETAVAKGLIKESLEKGGRGKTIEALKAYNNEVAKKFGVLTGVFVPAATRSSAMTYGSLYNQLRKDPDLTEEQAHDRAMGFALTSGAITGIITAGFSAIGRGGVEDALLKGMTFRESKKLFQAMGNTGGISDANVAKAIKKVMGDSIKKYGGRTLGKKITKNVIDEGIEEGTDQLVNSFVEDVALNQDTPMLERMKQVWHAAQVGGILGGGVPAIQAGASRLKVTPMDQLQQRIRLQNDFADQVSSELESTGSPLAANQVREVLMTRARSRETTEVETPKSTSSESFVKEQNRSELETLQEQMGEQASELEKLNDSSTLPEPEAERSVEVQRREERKVSLNEESAATLANFSEAEEVQKSLETGNPSEFTEGITDGEIAPETFIGSLSGATPLEVETAFENIRNQQNVSFAADEETTTLNMGDPTGATPINFTKEQENARASGATLTGESKINVALHNTTDLEVEPAAKSKRYSSRSGTGAISFSESPFSGGNAAEKANKLISFAVTNGFPAGLTHQVNYGLPMARAANRQSLSKSPEANYGLPMASGESRQYLSEFVASAVYAAYPKLAPPKNAKPYTSKQPTKTYFDPVSGKTVSQKVEGFIDDSGNGIFDNDPITMIDMLKSGKLVKIPRTFNVPFLNPSIRIKDGVVIDVVGPTADGNLIESKVNGASRVASVEPNNARAGHIARIPFKKAALPAGVKDFDFTNGGPLDVDFADTTNIKRRIGRFSLELAKTGDDTNRQVQGRLKSDSGSLSPEFKAAALESASQDFLLNAQLFSLREKFLTNPDAILNDIVAQTGSRNIDEAAQILLPLVSVESNTEITSEGILGLFVEQKLQGNADFANNSPPTFDALLAKAANKFKAQEEMASSIRSQRAVSTLPFDVTSSEFKTAKVADWVANFGRNPEGQLASPEAIGGVVSSAITTSIEAVNTDPDLRRAINKITLDHILDDTTPEMADMVQTANARDIFGIFISWVSSGNGNTRESVTEFMKNLEDGVYPSSDKLKSALLLANFATHSDRNGYSDPDAVNEYRDLFNQETGQEINTDQARDTMIALTKAVRTHLSRSNISESERSSVTAQNELDVQRLGLESGNPASVIEALKVVSKNVDNPSHQVVADLLLLDTSFINSVKFLLGPSTGDIAGKYVKGLDGSHTVFINTTSGNGRGIVNTLLEEYVHAFVSDITSATPAQVANMPRGMKTRLAALNTVLSNARTAYAKQVKVSGPVPSLDNALVDLNEFFAQFLLSEDVQKHVKGLEAPANRSSFFSRFLTNMVMLFPKMNTSQVKSAVDALTDVLDVGSNTRKTTPTDPKVFGGSIAGKALSSAPVTPQRDVEEAQQMQQDLQQEIQQEIQQEKELKQQEQGDIKRQEDARLESEFLSSVPEADRPRMGRILNYVRGIVPFGMDIKVTTNTGGSSAYVTSDESTIFVNPVEMMKLATDVQDIAGKALIGVVINEELAHTASFSALTKEEIQGYIDSLSDSDFQDIAREYYTNTPDGSFLKTTLENLASEDPAIANLEKYKMAEEKLRMHLQKVTRGFTTEDDTQFWSSKPSLLRMLKRYLTGVINRWVYSRKKIGAAADVALNKMIIEMRAIEVGFVRQPTKMAFDTENPMDVFQMYGTVNQDFVGLASAPVDAPIKGVKKKNSLRLRMTRRDIIEAVEDSTDWKDFYSRHEKLLKEYFGTDAELFQRILSATSQAASVKSNVALALKAYGQMKRGEPFLDSKGKGYLKGVASNLEKIRDGEELRGRKISNYDKASAGDTSKVVVDRHIARMLFNTTSPSKAQFEKAEKVLAEIANTLGWEPRQVQAALWGASIRKSGETPVSYDGWLQTLYERNDIERRIGSPLPKDGGDTIRPSARRSDIGRDSLPIGGGARRLSAAAIEEPEAGSLLPNVLSETLNTDVGGSDISWGDDQRLMAAPTSSPEAFPALDKALGDKIKSETKEIAVIQIDRMRVGDYKGTPLQGGMFYPTIDDNLKNRVAWAFNSKGAARDVLKRVRETGGYAQLVLMSQGNIVGNKTFSKIWFEEVERAVSSRKLTKKRVLEHLNEVRARKEDKTGHKKVWKTIKEAKEQIVNMPQMKRASNYMGKSKTTTVSRGEHMRYGHLLAKSAGEGFPDAEKLVEALEDPTFKGFEATTVVGIIKFDVQPDSAPILTGAEAGVPEHLSYKYVLKGEPVARLQKRVLLDEQYPETKNFLMTQAGLKTPVSGLYAAPTGQSSAAPTGTGIDFSAVVDLLEVPVYEIDMGKPKNFIARSLTEMFAGHIPEAFRRLIQNRDAYKRATEKNVIAYKKEMDKLIVKTYGSYENAPTDMIARAQGYYSGNVVTEQALDAIEAAYNKVYAAAEKGRKDKTITRGEAKILKDKALLTREKEIDKAYGAAVKVREADRDAALRDLAKDSSALAAHIIDIRQKLIIPLQEKLVKSGLNKEIGIKISKTGGIYVTRSYRMFTDSSFLETVKTDPLYEAKREAAMAFFVKSYLAKTKTDHINAGMDPAPAEIEAKKDLDRENKLYPHSSYGQEALNTFFLQYKEGGRDSSTSMGPQDYKMIEDNLKQRKDLPKEIREILGEHGPETGIDLILKTYSTVANVASQQAFLNQLKFYGEEGDVMVDSFTLNATEKSRKKYKDLGFVPARSGPPSKNDPLSGMYVSAEFKEALDVTLKDSFILANADTAERAVKGMFGLAANLSGKAMALKTLGSVGFYFRNAVGNFLFGSAQGYFRYDKMAMSMVKGSVDALFNPDKIDPVVSELIGLNVMGDELRAGVMRDLLNGKVTPEGITKQISELGEKTKLNKGTKALAFVEKKAQDLSAALDAAYKVVYYNHELDVLKKAQAGDPAGLGSKSDTAIKRMAARKVVMTSQAYSQAPPAVAAFTKTPLGLVLAPFIRFKMEVPRIVINTFKLAKEEIRSGNPVLISRGRWRRNSMIGMLAGASSALPMIMAALSGIGDEEDESLRASGPVYLRGHTFFYQGKGKDLKSWDLTYLNPFSLIVDPFLRAFENIRRGEYTEAGAAFAKGFVLDQYLDDQILAGAVKDATRNHNPATGKPIWTSGADGPVEAGVKLLGFVAKEAYAPRIGKDFFEGWATGSLSGMKDSLVSGMLPVRRYDVDLSKQYSRYLLDLNKRYTNVKSNLNAVRRANPMSDGAVKDIIDDNIEDRRLLNYELMRINKGFKGLGLTDTDLLKGMKDMKLGRDRVALLSRGYMDRPSIKYTIERLLDPRNKEHGPARAQQIIDHYRTFNRYIPIRPITESE